MYKFIYTITFLLVSLFSFAQNKDTVKISNDSLEFEIVILDAGFNSWLITNARPRGFYSLEYLEIKNRFFVSDWNRRVISSSRRHLYDFMIDYDFNIKYGYEVNYLLFNYFLYFMNITGERFSGFNRYGIM